MRRASWQTLFFAVSVLSFSGFRTAAIASGLPEARAYRLTERADTDFPSTTTVTVFPRADARFDVSVSIIDKHEWEFSGTGALGDDGWIRFPWVDNRGRKGSSSIRLLDRGNRLKIKLDTPGGRSTTLPWTKEPILDHVRTRPGKYLIHLPGRYESADGCASLALTPATRGKVRVTANLFFSPDSSMSLSLEGRGAWEDGDNLDFSSSDSSKDNHVKAQVHFADANKAILTIIAASTKDPGKEAAIRKFNEQHHVLVRYAPDDEGMTKDIGW